MGQMPEMSEREVRNKIAELMAEADADFQREHLLLAYNGYYQVLELDPFHQKAWEKIRAITSIYKERGEFNQSRRLAYAIFVLSDEQLDEKVAQLQKLDVVDQQRCALFEDILAILQNMKSLVPALSGSNEAQLQEQTQRLEQVIDEFRQQQSVLCEEYTTTD